MKKIKSLQDIQNRIRELNEEEAIIRIELYAHINEIGHHLTLKNIVEHSLGELRKDPGLIAKIISAGSLVIVSYLHRKVSRTGKKQSLLSTIVEIVTPVQITSMVKNASTEIYRWMSKKKRKPAPYEQGNEVPIDKPVETS